MKSLPIVTLPAPPRGGTPDGPGIPTASSGAQGQRGGGLAPSHLADLDLTARRAAMATLGEPAYRAGQVSRHYFGRLVRDPSAMTDLPAAARERIAGALLPTLLTPVQESSCDGGATRKLLWRLHDGALVESVLMEYPDRVTACVSSQAGCGMACPFCATGQAGLTRNLSTAEIVDQVVSLAAVASQQRGQRLSHVVFMGMGEPLANYARVVAAVRRLVSPPPEGLGLSQRHITISTVGLVPAMRRLADEGLAATLAISLHAPDDDLRDELVPVNQRWKVAEVLDTGWEYVARTGRRLSIEYAMIRDVNDHPWRADRLAELLAGRPVHVNLIPLNPTPGSRWDASPKPVEREFVRRLRAAGVTTTVRDTRGREIDGACGQLAAELTVADGAGGLASNPPSERPVPGSSEPTADAGSSAPAPRTRPGVGQDARSPRRSDGDESGGHPVRGRSVADSARSSAWRQSRSDGDGLGGRLVRGRSVADSARSSAWRQSRSDGDGLGGTKPVVGRSSEGTERSDR